MKRTRAHQVSFIVALPIAIVILTSLSPVLAIVTPSPDILDSIVAEAMEKPPPEPPFHLDVRYRRALVGSRRLDIYEPLGDAETPAPAIVVFHGGSWVRGDKVTVRIADRFLRRMREQGYFVIAVNYTTSALRGLTGPVENAKTALAWIVEQAGEYGYDPQRIGLYGVSAGGHVALMAVSTMPRIEFSFAFVECAPTDLVAMREGEAFESSSVFRMFRESRLRELSPIQHVGAHVPPVLIYHGTQDRIVHVNQSASYVAAVTTAGGDAELVLYPEGDHAFINLPDETWFEQETQALEFFARHFSGAGRGTTAVGLEPIPELGAPR